MMKLSGIRPLLKPGMLLFYGLWFSGVIILIHGWGYGIDLDAWRNAESMRQGIAEGKYSPTRFPVATPGFEFLNFIIMPLGAFWGTLLTGLVSCGLLGVFYLLAARDLNARAPLFLTLLVALHPLYIIESAENMDYLWGCCALALLLAGIWRGWNACLLVFLAGSAIALRITNFLPAMWILGSAKWFSPRDCQRMPHRSRSSLVILLLAASMLGGIAYLPGFLKFGFSMFGLPDSPITKNMVWENPLDRFLSFYPLPAIVSLLAALLLVGFRGDRAIWRQWLWLFVLWVLLIAPPLFYHDFYPSYLVASWPFFCLLLSKLTRRWLIAALMILLPWLFGNWNAMPPHNFLKAKAVAHSLRQNNIRQNYVRGRNRKLQRASQAQWLNQRKLPKGAYVVIGQDFPVFAWHLTPDAQKRYQVLHYMPKRSENRINRLGQSIYALSEEHWDLERQRGEHPEMVQNKFIIPSHSPE